jgi:hypothetical protein
MFKHPAYDLAPIVVLGLGILVTLSLPFIF